MLTSEGQTCSLGTAFTTTNNTVDMGHASFLSSSRIQASACLTKCSGEGILSVFKQVLA